MKEYSEDYIVTDSQTQKIVILPFELKTKMKKMEEKEGKNMKYPVRISNLDYDITLLQLQKLADDYGEVSHIDLNQRHSGINKGFATVYFQQRKSAQQFATFLDDFLYQDRRLKAQFVNTSHSLQMISKEKKMKEEKYLEVPTYTFKANEELMKKVMRRSVKNSKQIQERIPEEN